MTKFATLLRYANVHITDVRIAMKDPSIAWWVAMFTRELLLKYETAQPSVLLHAPTFDGILDVGHRRKLRALIKRVIESLNRAGCINPSLNEIHVHVRLIFAPSAM